MFNQQAYGILVSKLPARAFAILIFSIIACAGNRIQAAPAIPAFTKAASFSGAGTLTAALVGPGPDGSQRLYATYTYGTSLDLVAFDPVHNTHQAWSVPYTACNTMAFGPDGALYLGTYRDCHVLRFDVKTQDLEDLGEAATGELGVWQITFGPDGNLYGGTDPGGKLFQLDLKSKKFTDYGAMDPPQRHVRTVCAALDGWVYCGIGTAQASIIAFNPKTGGRHSLLPETNQGHGTPLVVQAADKNAYGIFRGKFYRLHDGAETAVETLPAPVPQAHLSSGVEAALLKSYQGHALSIYNLATGPDGKVYGSGYKTEQLFQYDPAKGTTTTLGSLPGMEAYAFLSAQGKLYIASYPHATLQVYDPAKPFNLGTTPGSNPRNYGSVAPHQDRPFGMTLGADGNIYVACVNATGGVLAWFDPKTGQLGSTPTPQVGHGLMSVCALPSGLIACGTSGRNPDRSYSHAELFFWDPKQQKVVFDTIPVPDAHDVRSLTLGQDGLLYGVAGRALFVFDPALRQVVATASPSQGPLAVRGALRRLADGRIVALAGNSALLVRYVHGKCQLQEFARHESRLLIGQAAVGAQLYAVDQTETQIVRCSITTMPSNLVPLLPKARKVSSPRTVPKHTAAPV